MLKMNSIEGSVGYSEGVQLGLGILLLLLFVLLLAGSCAVLWLLGQERANERGYRVPARLKEAQSPVSI